MRCGKERRAVDTRDVPFSQQSTLNQSEVSPHCIILISSAGRALDFVKCLM